MADKKPNEQVEKKHIRYSTRGRIYVVATFNNTLITVTDDHGQTLCWGSCGKSGFSGTRKSTPFAATSAIEAVLRKAQEVHGLMEAGVYLKGAGPGRDSLLRVLRNSPIDVTKLVDMTPIPHDGIRPKKRRRV
jgi:small subunit ribosomal protein S11